MSMQKLMVGLIVGLLWLWPVVAGAGASGRTGEQNPEQRQLLTKDQIQQIQERLKAEGVDPGPVDGVMSPRTEAALRQYQEKHGLTVSGAADEETLARLQIQILPRGEPGSGGEGGGGGAGGGR
jgi:peptidoglycan hydrolase-like protein with peptidoglycan-binding domain